MPVEITGIDHVYFSVRDLAAAELRALGIETSAPRLYPEYAEDDYATFFCDLDGIRLEVTNFRRQRRQRMYDWDAPG